MTGELERLDPAGIVVDGSGNKYSIPAAARDTYRKAFEAIEVALLPDGRLLGIPADRRDELRLTEAELARAKSDAAEQDTAGFDPGIEAPEQFYNGVC